MSESARAVSPMAGPTQGAIDPQARIVTAVAALNGVDELPLSAAAVVFDDLHNELQNALADLDRP